MDTPSEAQLLALAERFGLDLEGDDVAELRERVGANLASVGRLGQLSIEEPTRGETDRSSRRVTPGEEYECNEVVTECDVPPTAERGPLSGLELGLKDNVEVAGVPMTAASTLLEEFVPGTDAPVVRRILEAGGRVVAKTNLDELGNAGLGTNGWGGPIRNPYDPDRTAGGSSGGSAAAVANGVVDAALGTDTGGSVRIPAAYCGVVGMKPSFGLVPRTGVVENTSLQDHVGPIAGNVETVARVLDAIAGPDVGDAASEAAAGRPTGGAGDYLAAVRDAPEASPLRIGVVEEGFEGPCREDVVDRTRAAIERLEADGASTRTVSIPHYEYGVPIKSGLSYPANATLWRDRGMPYRHGGRVRSDGDHRAALAEQIPERGGELNADMKAKILAGAVMIEERAGREYVRAHVGREHLRWEFERALAEVDVLLTPTMPDLPPPLSECPPEYDYGWNVRHPNIVHLPAITLPNGSLDGLPVGLQLVGGRGEDATVLAVASAVERVLG